MSSGLTAGATPDVLNVYRRGGTTQPVWQVNGNTFAYTFPRLSFVLLASESLVLVSVGTFTATGTITATADLIEVPAQMLAKLV